MILCSEYGGHPNTIIGSFVCDSVDFITVRFAGKDAKI